MKNKEPKRILCVLLSSVCVLSAAGCGKSSTGLEAETESAATEQATTSAAAETTDPLEALGTADYKGYTFRMLIRNHEDWIGDMIAEEMKGEVVNDAVFRRNMETAERLNITFTHTPSSSYNTEMDAKPLILAGEDAYELVIPHARAAHRYANEGLVLNWNNIDHLNLSMPWWDQDARESFQIGDALYTLVGDISHMAVGSIFAMLFNKDYFDENQLAYPYETVRNGDWTMDLFMEMSETYARDVDGNSEMNESDIYGYVTQCWIGPIQAFYSSGARVIDKTSENYDFRVYNERSVTMFEKYFTMAESPYALVENENMDLPADLFRTGHSLFFDCAIRTIPTMRDMEGNFGIIPWPKLEESDTAYWSNVEAGTNLMTIPLTVSDPDMVGMVLETLAILGERYVIPAYYEKALKTRDSRDSDSAEMLDILVQNRIFDLGYYNEAIGGTFASHFSDMARSTDRNFTSWYESKLTAATQAKDEALATYAELAEKEWQ